MPYLERTFLNDGPTGLNHATSELKDLLLEGMTGDEILEDRRKLDWERWIEEQVQEALFNSTVLYNIVYGVGSGTSRGKSELQEKLETWKKGASLAKGKYRTLLPSFIEKAHADDIATRSQGGVLWLPLEAKVVPLDVAIFQGTFGVVRRVRIKGVSFIPEWIEFAGKTMTIIDKKKRREERTIESLACPVDHPRVIKLHNINIKTLESYSLWWNGGFIKSMRAWDAKYADDHESEILREAGPDYEARKRLVVYRKNRAYLAWALMCIVDVVHKYDVLHNDINPNNVMLHFSEDWDGAIFISVCDWGMASFKREAAPSNYGVDSQEALVKHGAQYNCAALEFFHVHGARGSSLFLLRISKKHAHTFKLESWSVGTLTKKIYGYDNTSLLFQQNRDPNSVKLHFECGLDELTEISPDSRKNITHMVNTLKSPPYNLETPTMCFCDSPI